MLNIETDRHPGRKVWFGNLEDSVNGLELRKKVRMKPLSLRVSEGQTTTIKPEEVLLIERHPDGRGIWHTIRAKLIDLDAPMFPDAKRKARRHGVFVNISEKHCVAPTRILSIQQQAKDKYSIELEGALGEPMELNLEPRFLLLLEEVLEALNLGDGFLFTHSDDIEDTEDF